MRPLYLSAAISLYLISVTNAATDRHRIVWRDDPTTRAVICWNQSSGKDPILYYGLKDGGSDPSSYNHNLEPNRREEYLEMDTRIAYLEELKPDSTYYFLIKDSEGLSPRYWFRTAPDKPQPFTFITGGDTKSDDEARKRGQLGNQLVAKLRPLFVLFDGDFTSGNGLSGSQWRDWLEDWTTHTTSKDGRIYPLVPVRGNHEADPEILYRLFGLKNEKHYFAFNIGDDLLRVYCLNSQIKITPMEGAPRAYVPDEKPKTKEPEKEDPRTPEEIARDEAKFKLIKEKHDREMDKREDAQTEWIRNDLSENEAITFKIAAYHKPLRPHTQSKPDNDYLYKPWAELFYKHRLTLAIEGDSHMHKITYPLRPTEGAGGHVGYIRDDENGTIFVGEGSWGAVVRANDDDKPWTLHSASVAQIKWLHVYPEHMELRTVLTAKAAQVEANTEEALLAVPKNLNLLRAPAYGTVLKIPFRLNGEN